MTSETYPEPKTLSVVMPIYNELDTWHQTLARVTAANVSPLDKEIILVDDGSTDGTREQLATFAAEAEDTDTIRYTVLMQEVNCGKGAALRRGFQAASGDIVIVQDADLEYDPSEFETVIAPILDGRAQVVYGSRFAARADGADRGATANRAANWFLTRLSNVMTGQSLTDMETCYKAVRRELLVQVDLHENRFGFEPELTAKLSRLGVEIQEVPISYAPRSHEAGKKIGYTDGLRAIWCILKYKWS